MSRLQLAYYLPLDADSLQTDPVSLVCLRGGSWESVEYLSDAKWREPDDRHDVLHKHISVEQIEALGCSEFGLLRTGIGGLQPEMPNRLELTSRVVEPPPVYVPEPHPDLVLGLLALLLALRGAYVLTPKRLRAKWPRTPFRRCRRL